MIEYMVIESIQMGKITEVYERFRTRGRLLPEGLEYIESWLSKDERRCFQLMRTENPALFDLWFEQWNDLVEFEVVEIGQKPA